MFVLLNVIRNLKRMIKYERKIASSADFISIRHLNRTKILYTEFEWLPVKE